MNWELTTALTLAALCLTTLQAAQAQTNLVPKTPATAPNYYCTWAAQNYVFGQGAASLDPALLEGGSGSWKANQAFTESQTFGPKGWAKTFYPKVRQDLYFLMDDGYYTGSQHSMELDTKKFPSFAGTPAERLTKLSQAIHQDGWRGLALWTRGTPNTPDQIEPLLEWSKAAGVKYWKIDGGDNDLSVQHLKQTVYPELTLEHVNGEGPFNGDWAKDGRFGTQSWDSHRLYVLRNTAVYRTYDVSPALSVSTTLDRVAQMFSGAQNHPEVTGLLNCEDEVYIAAALGCTMGVMRFPLTGLRPDGDKDLFFNGARQTKRRMDEVTRALHWQRIAEPYGAGQGYVKLDDSILTDDWQFQRGETWDSEVIGKLVKQGAPARVSRNLPLPTVTTEGSDPPFVIAGRFPNGAVSVCTLERTLKDHAWFLPPTDVTVDAGDAPGPFGVFGHYRSLTLRFSHALPAHARILAQDLAGTQATDITKQVHISGGTVTFPGALIEKIGKQAETPGDLSDPGLVIAIRGLQSASDHENSHFSNGLALTPPMGFNTWNTFKMNPTEAVVKQTADAIVSKGFQAAGYQYVNIDEGWDKGRDAEGQMIVDSVKFPNGLKAVADYIHSKGLKAGIYTELGPGSPGYIGSEGHYDEDMKTFASWGFDYVKVDVNSIHDRSGTVLRDLFSQMSEAVNNCGRPMVYSICNQGDGDYSQWASAKGNLWRVGKDIDYSSWSEPYQTTQWQGVLYELDHSMAHPELARPGNWNDADMLLVGVAHDKLTVLTPEEAQSHFSLWCVISSPLIIGADLSSISPEAVKILTNTEAIAVNQDPYGQQARLVSDRDGLQVYSKRLESATSRRRGVVLLNRRDAASSITVTEQMLGLATPFSVRDLWAKKDLGTFHSYTAEVPPHGCVMVKIN